MTILVSRSPFTSVGWVTTRRPCAFQRQSEPASGYVYPRAYVVQYKKEWPSLNPGALSFAISSASGHRLPNPPGFLQFFLCGTDEFLEDLGFVLFAFFNVVWATLYLKSWKRRSSEISYQWGTADQRDELLSEPRPLFKVGSWAQPMTDKKILRPLL